MTNNSYFSWYPQVRVRVVNIYVFGPSMDQSVCSPLCIVNAIGVHNIGTPFQTNANFETPQSCHVFCISFTMPDTYFTLHCIQHRTIEWTFVPTWKDIYPTTIKRDETRLYPSWLPCIFVNSILARYSL